MRKEEKSTSTFKKAAHNFFFVCKCVSFCNQLPFLGRHQSSKYPDNGEEWQERTVFVIFFNEKLHFRFVFFFLIKNVWKAVKRLGRGLFFVIFRGMLNLK